ncbi:MAG: hypothetical protein NC548_49560, partial [Lachnospiraceae bacterium]|nr:hypothetical protein [Lachnospiraceae bacterium]
MVDYILGSDGNIQFMSFEFIQKYFPDYDHSDIIAWEDNLYCAITGECVDEKLERIKRAWGNTMEELELQHEELLKSI